MLFHLPLKSAILSNHRETAWSQQRILLLSLEEMAAHSVTFTHDTHGVSWQTNPRGNILCFFFFMEVCRFVTQRLYFKTKLFVGFVPTLIAYLVAQTSCLKRLPKCNLSIFSCPPTPLKPYFFIALSNPKYRKCQHYNTVNTRTEEPILFKTWQNRFLYFGLLIGNLG